MKDFICVYDSGLGGLIETSKIIKDNPKSNIYYLGDSKNAPYGNKTTEDLQNIFNTNIKKIKALGIKDVIVACNTMCSAINPKAYQDIKIWDIVDLTVEVLKDLDRSLNILVCATPYTIAKGRYENSLKAMGFKHIQNLALDDLAKMIEDFKDMDTIKSYLFECFKKVEGKVDVVVLACTHYPIVEALFKEYFNASVYSSMDIPFDLDLKGEGKLLIDMPKSDNLKQFIDRYIGKDVVFCQSESY